LRNGVNGKVKGPEGDVQKGNRILVELHKQSSEKLESGCRGGWLNIRKKS